MHSASLFNKHVNDFRQLLKTAYKCLPKKSNKKIIKMKIHTKRHILHITLHKILSQYVTLSPVSCYLLLYIYSNSNVLAEAETLVRRPSGQTRRARE